MRAVSLSAVLVVLIATQVGLAQNADPQSGSEPQSESGQNSHGTSEASQSTASDTETPAEARPAEASGSEEGVSTSESVSTSEAQELHNGSDNEPEEVLEEEEDDSGRGWFYLRLQGGLSYANIVAFSDENFLPEAQTIFGAGGTGGISIGLRLFIISVGVQATYAAHSDFNLGTVGLDVGVYLPIPFASPYVRLGLGYAWVANADTVPTEVGNVDVYGLFLELGLGIDIYVHKHIAVGGGFDGIFLSLSRQPAGNFNVLDVRFEEDGDAVGVAIRAQFRLTFSF